MQLLYLVYVWVLFSTSEKVLWNGLLLEPIITHTKDSKSGWRPSLLMAITNEDMPPNSGPAAVEYAASPLQKDSLLCGEELETELFIFPCTHHRFTNHSCTHHQLYLCLFTLACIHNQIIFDLRLMIVS